MACQGSVAARSKSETALRKRTIKVAQVKIKDDLLPLFFLRKSHVRTALIDDGGLHRFCSLSFIHSSQKLQTRGAQVMRAQKVSMSLSLILSE